MNQVNSVIPRSHQERLFPSLSQLIENINRSDYSLPIIDDGKAILDIKFDENGKPVRKVVKRSNYRQSYQLFSAKMNTTMSCESLIEFNGCYILETNPLIKKYHTQPALISYVINHEKHRHIPDALIEFNSNKKFFIEFKSEHDLHDVELQLRTDLLRKHLPAHGYGYLVVCDDQVEGFELVNAKKLSHIERTEVSDETLCAVFNCLRYGELISIKSLIETLKFVKNLRNILYQLIRQGVLGYYKCDEAVITDETLIFWEGPMQ